jgi:peptide/nickel transport system permease protein
VAMGAFIIRRLIMALVVLVLVSMMSFMLIELVPGDPAITTLGVLATQVQIDTLRKEMGLDQPLIVRYGRWMGNVLRGDFGKSMILKRDVTKLIVERLPITLHLVSMALILSTVLGVSAGVVCAVKRGSVLDQALTFLANIGISIPVFWLGILGVYLLGLRLDWLPVMGYTSPLENFWESSKQVIMPVMCMSLGNLAVMTRQARSSTLEVIHQDYIRTARAKGLMERVVISRHALKNALIPIVTLLGLSLPFLVSGSVLVETVFNIPGMGRLLVNSVFSKDFLLTQAGVLIVGAVVSLANLVVDISYGWLDPRIRYQ